MINKMEITTLRNLNNLSSLPNPGSCLDTLKYLNERYTKLCLANMVYGKGRREKPKATGMTKFCGHKLMGARL